GWFLLEEREWDSRTGRNTGHVTIVGPNGECRRYAMQVRTYTELAGLMSQAGLQPTAAYGSFDKTELTRESQRMIVVTEKGGVS
ncbi:MAG: hypothetical protein ACE5JM_18145, partial [Armatimonadota bacterium]